MRGSASTWVFNAVRLAALALAPDRAVDGRYVVRGAELPAADDPARLAIIKTHETDDDAAARLGRSARAIWLSIRDPRDCIASLMQYHDATFEAALQALEQDCRISARFRAHPRAHVLRYELGFFAARTTLDRIAGSLGGRLAAADRERIFIELSRPAVEAFIAGLETLPTAVRPSPGNLVDTVTQWHNHHANRTGESGRWRRVLSAAQAASVARQLGGWIAEFGYPAGMAVQPGMAAEGVAAEGAAAEAASGAG